MRGQVGGGGKRGRCAGGDAEEAKAREYKHMTFKEAAGLARDAAVKEMWLTHYSPSLVHPEDYMGDVKKIFPMASVCRDGRTKELDFEEE